MIVNSLFEFRGKVEKLVNGQSFVYVNLEDCNGEACKFPCVNTIDLNAFKKGDKVDVDFELSVKYSTFRVTGMEKVKGV